MYYETITYLNSLIYRVTAQYKNFCKIKLRFHAAVANSNLDGQDFSSTTVCSHGKAWKILSNLSRITKHCVKRKQRRD